MEEKHLSPDLRQSEPADDTVDLGHIIINIRYILRVQIFSKKIIIQQRKSQIKQQQSVNNDRFFMESAIHRIHLFSHTYLNKGFSSAVDIIQ